MHPSSLTVALPARMASRVSQEAAIRVIDPDRADLEACLGGDTEAYGRIVRRYEQEIARHLWSFTRDPHELEDLVQDVFVEAYRSLRSYRAQAPLGHWLQAIATRVGYRSWKARERERAHREEVDLDALPMPESPTPSEAAEYLFKVFGRLPAEDRLVLTLQYFHECDTAEIVSRTGWSKSLVKVRSFRARRRLKALMEKAGFAGVRDA